MSNPQSTAKIAGRPIHPMLIPFPIAFFVATFVCDIVYWQTTSMAWATPRLGCSAPASSWRRSRRWRA
jgi:uncharacterized membrane protein